ncbi:LysR family transcriptional regulator [Kutzneria viridogrisea]|uniref:DNA-binding transcriptional LysR family regulator n=1 Tax=Kutzneria viridogrisea TaxID=47990 RepID=A0ABR6BU25_9PSEU|nr:DNA-binding transcriptional LysR family regulator [Kutzneria viridogrisea]
MNGLELRHLRTMCAIAESNSVTKAAAALGLTQPALTAQLHRIEKFLGGQLFERTAAGTRPTALGREVVALAGQILADLDQLVQVAKGPRQPDGQALLTVGTEPVLFLGELVTQLKALTGGKDVQARVETHAAPLLEMLAGDRIHFAVIFGFDGLDAAELRGIELRELLVEPQFVMIAEDHPLAAHESIELAELAGFDWVTPPPETDSLRHALDSACRAAGFSPRRTHYATEVSTARALVLSGAVAPAAPASRSADGIAIRQLRGDPFTTTMYVATKADGPFAHYRREFFTSAARAYRTSVDRNPYYAKWWADNPKAHADLDAALVLGELGHNSG